MNVVPLIDILIFGGILVFILSRLRRYLQKHSDVPPDGDTKSSDKRERAANESGKDYQDGPWGASGNHRGKSQQQSRQRQNSNDHGSQREERKKQGSGEQTHSKSKSGGSFESDLKLFGLNEAYTLQQLKAARNRKLKENHPDKVAGLSEEIQRVAKEQTQRLNEAFERLKAAL